MIIYFKKQVGPIEIRLMEIIKPVPKLFLEYSKLIVNIGMTSIKLHNIKSSNKDYNSKILLNVSKLLINKQLVNPLI